MRGSDPSYQLNNIVEMMLLLWLKHVIEVHSVLLCEISTDDSPEMISVYKFMMRGPSFLKLNNFSAYFIFARDHLWRRVDFLPFCHSRIFYRNVLIDINIRLLRILLSILINFVKIYKSTAPNVKRFKHYFMIHCHLLWLYSFSFK